MFLEIGKILVFMHRLNISRSREGDTPKTSLALPISYTLLHPSPALHGSYGKRTTFKRRTAFFVQTIPISLPFPLGLLQSVRGHITYVISRTFINYVSSLHKIKKWPFDILINFLPSWKLHFTTCLLHRKVVIKEIASLFYKSLLTYLNWKWNIMHYFNE